MRLTGNKGAPTVKAFLILSVAGLACRSAPVQAATLLESDQNRDVYISREETRLVAEGLPRRGCTDDLTEPNLYQLVLYGESEIAVGHVDDFVDEVVDECGPRHEEECEAEGCSLHRFP